MVFSSSVFLFAFLPLFFLIYCLLSGNSLRNIFLLGASLFFYAWGEPIYIWLMVFSIALNWGFGILISPMKPKPLRVMLLLIAVTVNLALLGFYKYEGFIAFNINQLVGYELLPNLHLPLPIGISFYTLQAITYLVDVYRREAKAQPNPLYLGMYIAMFPQLVAGPIVRYLDIAAQINNRQVTLEGIAQGGRLFAIGLGKKVLLSNTIGILAAFLLEQDASDIGFIGCFASVVAYTFQIYFDFGGYSDMAIGLGKMMGFDYPRNFNYPYISKSVTEFWRRWHITLGSFFRDYVYIPMGGNRVSIPHWMLNIFVVWGLTGIWHGASWNFLLWGLYYGVLLMIEKLFLLKVLDFLPNLFGHLWFALTVFFGWMLFCVTDIADIGEWLLGLTGAYGLTGTSTMWELRAWSFVSLLPVLLIGSTPVFPWMRMRLEAWLAGTSAKGKEAAPVKGNDFVPACSLRMPEDAIPHRQPIGKAIAMVSDVCLLIIFMVSAACVAAGGYNPFIYFQF